MGEDFRKKKERRKSEGERFFLSIWPQPSGKPRQVTYKDIQELRRKKRFLLRVHCWQCHQLSGFHRAPHPIGPDKAYRLGYKTKEVKVILYD